MKNVVVGYVKVLAAFTHLTCNVFAVCSLSFNKSCYFYFKRLFEICWILLLQADTWIS